MSPKRPGLYFIGLVQPIGAVMPLAEIQSEWVADLLQGRATLSSQQHMNREIARYRAVTARRYGRSAPHTIQVDFLAYRREISRERRHIPLPACGVSPGGTVHPSSACLSGTVTALGDLEV